MGRKAAGKRDIGDLLKVLRLSFHLAITNFKLKNEGSFLGICWYLLEPLLMFLVILLVRSAIIESAISHYPIYLLIGLIIFNFFRKTTASSLSAISGNIGILKSMKIATESFVIADVVQALISHVFEMLILAGFMIFLKVPLVGLLGHLFSLLIMVPFVLGVSFVLSAFGTYVNDIENVWNVATRILWFATPIFYLSDKRSPIAFLNRYNPLYYFISISRDYVLPGNVPDPLMLVGAMAISVTSLAIGLIVFEGYKEKFVEAI